MHCRDRTVFINNLVIFRRFWKMTRFLKSIIKQKVFIPGLWYLKLEILSNWKLTYSKIRNFHWKDFEQLAFEHVRLKSGHTVVTMTFKERSLYLHSWVHSSHRSFQGRQAGRRGQVMAHLGWHDGNTESLLLYCFNK